jgi:hypothetical protein
MKSKEQGKANGWIIQSKIQFEGLISPTQPVGAHTSADATATTLPVAEQVVVSGEPGKYNGLGRPWGSIRSRAGTRTIIATRSLNMDRKWNNDSRFFHGNELHLPAHKRVGSYGRVV